MRPFSPFSPVADASARRGDPLLRALRLAGLPALPDNDAGRGPALRRRTEHPAVVGPAPAASVRQYGGLTLLLYWLAALAPSSMTAVRQVELTVGEHSVLLPAMVDTGNLLRDPITGLPVMVVPFRAVRVLVPEIARWVQHQELPPRMRLISVRTAAGSSLLPVFRPDSCRLYLNGHSCDADVVVAVTGQEYGGIQALVPLAALPEGGALPAGMEE